MHALGAPGELRGCSGGVPGTLQGGSGSSRGPLGRLRGRPGHPRERPFGVRKRLRSRSGRGPRKRALFSRCLRLFLVVFGQTCCLRLSSFRSHSRARGAKATPSNLMTLTRDWPLFPVRRMMQLRSGPVVKRANWDSTRRLRIEANLRGPVSPFGDHFRSVFTRKSSRRAWKSRPKSQETAEGVSGASRERLGSSRTAFGTAGRQKVGSKVDPKSVSKAEAGGRVLHSKSRQNRQNLTHVRHACQGAADFKICMVRQLCG